MSPAFWPVAGFRRRAPADDATARDRTSCCEFFEGGRAASSNGRERRPGTLRGGAWESYVGTGMDQPPLAEMDAEHFPCQMAPSDAAGVSSCPNASRYAGGCRTIARGRRGSRTSLLRAVCGRGLERLMRDRHDPHVSVGNGCATTRRSASLAIDVPSAQDAPTQRTPS
jgi:hypothetical protein